MRITNEYGVTIETRADGSTRVIEDAETTARRARITADTKSKLRQTTIKHFNLNCTEAEYIERCKARR
jgi:hypothetical protein